MADDFKSRIVDYVETVAYGTAVAVFTVAGASVLSFALGLFGI